MLYVQALVFASLSCPRCLKPGTREMRTMQLGTIPGKFFVTGQGLARGRVKIFQVQLQQQR